jgi:2-keto-4-pentenoate hydratase
MSPDDIAAAARYYRDIFERRGPLSPPPSCRPTDLTDAYDVQLAWAATFADGTRGELVGYKIALTTPVMQQLLGFDQPCIGPIFETSIHESPSALDFDKFGRPGVECEIAVRLGADLDAGPYDRDSVGEAVAACMAAIEIVDDQNADYAVIDAHTLIASGAWNGGCILSKPVAAWREVDLRGVVGTLVINGEEIEAGRGADVMGHPFEALAFVANTLVGQGRPLRRGMIVMTGSLVGTKWPARGDEVMVRMDGVGQASASFGQAQKVE